MDGKLALCLYHPPRSSVLQSRKRCWALPGGTAPRTWNGSWAHGNKPESCGCHGDSSSRPAAQHPLGGASGRGKCDIQPPSSTHWANVCDEQHPYLREKDIHVGL